MSTARANRQRSISASICLLVIVLLYAPLAGAAWASYQSSCCMTGQCPIAAHHHHQKAPAAPSNHMDCGHDMPGMMACSLSCCHDSDRSLLGSIAFVLPSGAAAATVNAAKSPVVLAKPLDFPRFIEPFTPPPRLLSSAD